MNIDALEKRAAGLQALKLIAETLERNPGAGQSFRLARFLASCYNSYDYPYVLRDLRGLDYQLSDACLTYLRYDATGDAEVHELLSGGEKQMQGWIQFYGIKKASD